MHPNTSEQVRASPKTSKNLRKPEKNRKNYAKIRENPRKIREDFAKVSVSIVSIEGRAALGWMCPAPDCPEVVSFE